MTMEDAAGILRGVRQPAAQLHDLLDTSGLCEHSDLALNVIAVGEKKHAIE